MRVILFVLQIGLTILVLSAIHKKFEQTVLLKFPKALAGLPTVYLKANVERSLKGSRTQLISIASQSQCQYQCQMSNVKCQMSNVK